MLLVSSSRGRWIIPKGWAREGEGPAAAAREALEEAGIAGVLDDEPVGRFAYVKRDPDMVSRGQVIIHLLLVRVEHKNWKEQSKRRRLWVSPREGMELADDQGLRDLLRRLNWRNIEARIRAEGHKGYRQRKTGGR
jgi:8-oxo-dGTP pyrophosphatase MutT (NUDIX family)